ncbi:hypothetical protein JKP88DRAFT_315256 [Tribonema minus]|uniref:DUF5710 domain-containing protein n=1 Tax=Tribonema minus TaxID=303371 RepID=A0A836CFT6_9STRA|nr:hypothetical protein JKP88DRAFT_315256 [Tribonema minus]
MPLRGGDRKAVPTDDARSTGKNVAEALQSRYGMKVYLEVPYDEREAVKRLGAKWDAAAKRWYASTPYALLSLRGRLMPGETVPQNLPRKAWVHLPYANKEAGKSLGAKFDAEYKCWYAKDMECMQMLVSEGIVSRPNEAYGEYMRQMTLDT